ncbi:MAG: triose-phosphate isomerase [Planctomycetota bacterium]|nr:MAG: triose-phosphate isomerase [Planctomycetota bacterium]
MRTPVVFGNWKMNTLPAQGVALVKELAEKLGGLEGIEYGVCPPATHLADVVEAAEGSGVQVGAQNMHHEPKGAFTGEISARMVLATGARWVVLGHSERRHVFGEQDDLIHSKLCTALEAGLRPILCIGEKLDEREAGRTTDVVEHQLVHGFGDLAADEVQKTVIAYEPVWAIGTGKTATPEQAQDVHAFIRGWLKEKYGDETAASVRIQYGGSVKPSNVAELIARPDIDGALVGGASLKADVFAAIITGALEHGGAGPA